MVLYIRSGICYTKKEMNQAISEGKGNKEDFFPVHTLEDVRKCKHKIEVEEEHEPVACSLKYVKVMSRVIEAINRHNQMKPDSPYYMSLDHHDFYMNFESSLLSWKPMGDRDALDKAIKQYENITLLLKCLTAFNKVSHTMLVIVDIQDRKISKVVIADTAPVTYIKNPELLKTRLEAYLKTEKADTVIIYAPMNKVAEDLHLSYDTPILSLQTSEREFAKHGYCNAWVLYFINSIAKSKSVDTIYRNLIHLGTNEAVTAKIMRWWKKN
jgi:hypothetical protein